VIKRDGDRESFDRYKLLKGLARACEKTGISTPQMERVVDDIESELQQRAVREVPSSEIGELVLHHLRELNEVAYIRFASVYRKFQGIRDFVETLDQLQNPNGNFEPSAREERTANPVPSDGNSIAVSAN
jgi:transcriptional repressor NrdR